MGQRRPTVGVVTNIDAEHMEYYGTLDNLKKAFLDFCNGIPFYGYAVVCSDSENVRSILENIESVAITYGLEEGASIGFGQLHQRLSHPALHLHLGREVRTIRR